MTRKQAIERFAAAVHNPTQEYWPETIDRVTPLVDGFISLGMLEVDDPPATAKEDS